MAVGQSIVTTMRECDLEGQAIAVGLGEIAVVHQRLCILVAYGLGSCIGVAAYDPVGPVAGMIHAVLPRFRPGDAAPTKFVDSGIPALVAEMERHGAKQQRIRWYAAGGAQMLVAPGFKGMFNIGQQNIEMMHEIFARYGLTLSGAALGGHVGRTLKLYGANGRVTVRSAGQNEEAL